MAKSQSQRVNPIFPVHNKANPSCHFTPSRPSNTHEEGKRWETYLAFELGFRAFMCAVLWCGSGDLGIEVAHGNQPWFASCWKTTLNTNEPQNRKKLYGHQFSPVFTGKATTNPSSLLREFNLFLYLCLFYALNQNRLNLFSKKFINPSFLMPFFFNRNTMTSPMSSHNECNTYQGHTTRI